MHVRRYEQAQLRRFPFPYRAMLAICSDLDETPDRTVYEQTLRFLNTSDSTPMGPGVGLEVGGTIYFDMPGDQFAYWNTDDAGRNMIRAMIRSGHIDCLHSYGNLAATRAHAVRALDELDRHDCALQVWIDHGRAPTNLGADIMCGHGDQIDHPAYHADMTVAHGVRYVWRGRVTSMLGQDVSPRPMGAWTARHPLASAQTAAKETVKWLAGLRGHDKYAMHGPNRVLRPARLRDGQPVMEFLRANPHWGGVSSGETAKGVGEVITDAMLQRLVGRQGACVLYTHLGKVHDPAVPLDPSATAAFDRIARAQHAGRILVATTRRTLGYLDMRERVQIRSRPAGERLVVEVTIDKPGDRRFDAAGLTVYTPRPEMAVLKVDGDDVDDLWVNPPDHTGRPSVSVPWPRLAFPDF